MGFYIKKYLANQVSEIKGISERIAVSKIKINRTTKMCIIQVYAPNMSAEEGDIDAFYNQLQETYTKERELYTLVMGDFNAKIGNDSTFKRCIGEHTVGITNANGRRLINFAEANNLKAVSTFFKKKHSRKWTWKSPNGKVRNEIDHLLTNNARVVINAEVLSSFAFLSDHRICRCTFKIQDKNKSRNKYLNKAENFSNLVIPVHMVEEANNILADKLNKSSFWHRGSVQEKYDIIEEAIKRTIKEAGSFKPKITTDDKLSTETKELIRKRTELKKINPKGTRRTIELTELNKLIKKRIREDVEKFDFEQIKSIVELSGSTKKVRAILSKGKYMLPKIKRKDGGETAKEMK